MQILDSGVISSIRKDAQQLCCCSEICAMNGSRWLCAYVTESGTKDGKSSQGHLLYSDDFGTSWTDSYMPVNIGREYVSKGRFRSIFLTCIGKNRAVAVLSWVGNSENSACKQVRSRTFLSCTEDNGETWSVPKAVQILPFENDFECAQPIIVLPSQKFACQFETSRNGSCDSKVSGLLISSDGGNRWDQYIAVFSNCESMFWRGPKFAALRHGLVLALCSGSDKSNKSNTIFGRHSFDGGYSWSAAWETGIGGFAGMPVSKASGAVVFLCLERSGKLSLCQSEDGGLTWPETAEIPEFDAQHAAAMEQAGAGGVVNVPSLAVLPHDNLITCFFCPEANAIRWFVLSV